MDNVQIEIENDLKFLSVLFDERWTFMKHVREMERKAWGSVGQMNGLMRKKQITTKIVLYQSAIRHILAYQLMHSLNSKWMQLITEKAG